MEKKVDIIPLNYKSVLSILYLNNEHLTEVPPSQIILLHLYVKTLIIYIESFMATVFNQTSLHTSLNKLLKQLNDVQSAICMTLDKNGVKTDTLLDICDQSNIDISFFLNKLKLDMKTERFDIYAQLHDSDNCDIVTNDMKVSIVDLLTHISLASSSSPSSLPSTMKKVDFNRNKRSISTDDIPLYYPLLLPSLPHIFTQPWLTETPLPKAALQTQLNNITLFKQMYSGIRKKTKNTEKKITLIKTPKKKLSPNTVNLSSKEIPADQNISRISKHVLADEFIATLVMQLKISKLSSLSAPMEIKLWGETNKYLHLPWGEHIDLPRRDEDPMTEDSTDTPSQHAFTYTCRELGLEEDIIGPAKKPSYKTKKNDCVSTMSDTVNTEEHESDSVIDSGCVGLSNDDTDIAGGGLRNDGLVVGISQSKIEAVFNDHNSSTLNSAKDNKHIASQASILLNSLKFPFNDSNTRKNNSVSEKDGKLLFKDRNLDKTSNTIGIPDNEEQIYLLSHSQITEDVLSRAYTGFSHSDITNTSKSNKNLLVKSQKSQKSPSSVFNPDIDSFSPLTSSLAKPSSLVLAATAEKPEVWQTLVLALSLLNRDTSLFEGDLTEHEGWNNAYNSTLENDSIKSGHLDSKKINELLEYNYLHSNNTNSKTSITYNICGNNVESRNSYYDSAVYDDLAIGLPTPRNYLQVLERERRSSSEMSEIDSDNSSTLSPINGYSVPTSTATVDYWRLLFDPHTMPYVHHSTPINKLLGKDLAGMGTSYDSFLKRISVGEQLNGTTRLYDYSLKTDNNESSLNNSNSNSSTDSLKPSANRTISTVSNPHADTSHITVQDMNGAFSNTLITGMLASQTDFSPNNPFHTVKVSTRSGVSPNVAPNTIPNSTSTNTNSTNVDSTHTLSSPPTPTSTPPTVTAVESMIHRLVGDNITWNVLWTWRHNHLNHRPLLIHQKVNHFARSYHLTRKDFLKRSLKRFQANSHETLVKLPRGLQPLPEPKSKSETAQSSSNTNTKNLNTITNSNSNSNSEDANKTPSSYFDVLPRTYILPLEEKEFIARYNERNEEFASRHEQLKLDDPTYTPSVNSVTGRENNCFNVWIVKPSNSSRGRGIYLSTDVDEINEDANESKKSNAYLVPGKKQPLKTLPKTPSSGDSNPDLNGASANSSDKLTISTSTTPDPTQPVVPPSSTPNPPNKNMCTMVVQEYIANPLLLKGRKFDFRLYVLVTSFEPLEAYIYNEGYARYAMKPYSNDPNKLDDLFVHLTNSSVGNTFDNQEDDNCFAGLTGAIAGSTSNENEDTKKTENIDTNPKQLLSCCLKELHALGYDTRSILRDIDATIISTLLSVKSRVGTQPNAFEVYGFDIMLDDCLKPWLIEVNSSPSLNLITDIDRTVKPRMVADTLRLINPLPIDRSYLARLLYYKVTSGVWPDPPAVEQLYSELCNKLKTKRNTKIPSLPYFSNCLHFAYLYKGKRPRLYGEIPSNMGNYRRLAPGGIESVWTEMLTARKHVARERIPGKKMSGLFSCGNTTRSDLPAIM